jgi:hypothetical protein
MRVYFKDYSGNTRIVVEGDIKGGSPGYGRYIKNLISVHSYEFYGMPEAPDILLEADKSPIWDVMVAPDGTYNNLLSEHLVERAPTRFIFIEKDDFKTKLVSE